MTSLNATGWSGLALLALLAAPSTSWGQQSSDDADSYSESRNGNAAEPPRLMRGGIMQQLRSVTESVMGTNKDDGKPTAKDKPSSKPNSRSAVPTPPPLGSNRAAPEPRGRTYAPQDFQPSDSGATLPGRSTPNGRAWAGQFLIPNYRLRDQVGTKNFRAANDARRDAALATDVPQVPAAARGDRRGVITGGKVSGSPNTSPAERRVYLGQKTSPNAIHPGETDEELPEIERVEVGRERIPFANSDDRETSSELHLADEEPTQEELGEVLVSHVPDVPYVPRKPLPKRASQQQVANGAINDGQSQSAKPQPAKPQATYQTPQPIHNNTIPRSVAPATSPAALPAAPAASEPKVPSLELSTKLQNDATGVSVPSVPSKPLPSASKVPAQTVSTPSGSVPAGKPLTTTATTPTLAAPSTNATKTSNLPPAASSMPTMPSVPSVPSLEGSFAPPAIPAMPAGPLPSTSAPATKSVAPTLPPANTAKPAPAPFAPPALPQSPASLPPTLPSLAPPSAGAFPPAPTTPPAFSQAVTLPPAPTMTPPASLPPAAPSNLTTHSQAHSGTPAGANQRLHMEIPHVAVQLLGPGDLTAGAPTSYELQVHNSDRLSLSGLVLRMETPPGVQVVATGPDAAAAETEKTEDGATLLTWSVSQVNAGGMSRLPLQLTSNSPRNFAVAIEWTVLPQSGFEEITVKQADLQVALEGPVEVEKYQANGYRLRVSNPGSAPAKGVQVVVSTGAPNNNAVEVGDLNPGQTEVIELDLTFEKAGQVQIGAQATAGALSRSTNIQVNVRQPNVVAELAVPENVLHGTPLIVQVVVGNSGDAPARNLQAALQLPVGTEMAQLPAGVTRDGDRLLWNIPQISAGQEVQLPLELKLATPGAHELSLACVAPDGSVTNTKANVTSEAYADLKLFVNDPVAPAPVGAPVTYELTITNRGSLDAKNVQIVAQFSDGIEPESASGWNHQVVPGQVRFDTLPQIAAGQSVQLKVIAKASTAGIHRFRAEVRCEDNEARLVEEESTRYLDSTGRIASPPSTTINR